MKVQVKNLSNDRLEVKAVIDGREITAYGWQSAITNHYPPEHYQKDGHRKKSAKPREMTKQEKQKYYESLIQAQL